jgi:hypothetical protein
LVQKQLATLAESLEDAQARLRRLSDDTPETAWNNRPGAKRWSAADCVEHLNMTSRAYIPLLRDAIAEARQLHSPATTHYRRDPVGWFLSMMIGPMRHVGKFKVGKITTTADFVPKGGQSSGQLLSEFVRLQSELVTMIRSADALPLDRVKIVSPFGGRMQYNAYSALVVVARHQHRHIDQAQEALAG